MNTLTILLATTVNFTVQTACHPDDVKGYDNAKLRERFVMEKVMAADEIRLTYSMYDRMVYGGAMPVNRELTLESFDELKAEHFLDRRELGVINVGGDGVVMVDGVEYALGFKEALYVGMGKKEVKFRSFNVPDGQAICHIMGRPQEQRLVWLHNEQAITSPEWSVHSAAGTSNYMFIWGMGGENLDYGDMDKVPVCDMR